MMQRLPDVDDVAGRGLEEEVPSPTPVNGTIVSLPGMERSAPSPITALSLGSTA